MILVLFMFIFLGKEETMNYVNNRNYVETMFVFVIMVIAATRPILNTVLSLVKEYQIFCHLKELLLSILL